MSRTSRPNWSDKSSGSICASFGRHRPTNPSRLALGFRSIMTLFTPAGLPGANRNFWSVSQRHVDRLNVLPRGSAGLLDDADDLQLQRRPSGRRQRRSCRRHSAASQRCSDRPQARTSCPVPNRPRSRPSSWPPELVDHGVLAVGGCRTNCRRAIPDSRSRVSSGRRRPITSGSVAQLRSFCRPESSRRRHPLSSRPVTRLDRRGPARILCDDRLRGRPAGGTSADGPLGQHDHVGRAHVPADELRCAIVLDGGVPAGDGHDEADRKCDRRHSQQRAPAVDGQV